MYAIENDGLEEGSAEAEEYEAFWVESDFVIIEDKLTNVIHISTECCFGDVMRSIWEARKTATV